MASVWWEKTVEYLFVRSYIPDNYFIQPLDGNEETAAGDLVAGQSSFVLIEFKKDKSDLSSEFTKFRGADRYARAKRLFRRVDNHHYLIYGSEVYKHHLILEAHTYFSGCKRDPSLVMQAGVKLRKFNKYVKLLSKIKGRNEEAVSGRLEACVLGIVGTEEVMFDNDGVPRPVYTVYAMSLRDFVKWSMTMNLGKSLSSAGFKGPSP